MPPKPPTTTGIRNRSQSPSLSRSQSPPSPSSAHPLRRVVYIQHMLKFAVPVGDIKRLARLATVSEPFQDTISNYCEAIFFRWQQTDAASLDRAVFTLCSTPLGALACPLMRQLVAVGGERLVELRDAENRTLLYVATVANNIDLVDWLIERGADVNAPKRRWTGGATPFYIAVNLNHVECAKLMLDKADIEAGPRPPLLAAAEKGFIDGVRMLAGAGAKIDAVNTENMRETSLHAAARRGHADVVRFLVGRAARVDAQDANLNTPLHAAVSSGNLDVVRFLLAAGAPIEMMDAHGRTALIAATELGFADALRELLRAGACAQSGMKFAPLCIAALHGDVSSVEALLQAPGVGVDDRNSSGVTALTIAAASGHAGVVRALLQAGASAADGDALRCSVRQGSMECVRALLGACDANAANMHGATALHVAAEAGRLEPLRELLRAGGRADGADNDGRTPLFCAAAENCRDVVEVVRELLVHCTSNVDAVCTSTGSTALHAAVSRRNASVVEQLLEADANKHLRDRSGKTAMSIAVERHSFGVEKICSLLK